MSRAIEWVVGALAGLATTALRGWVAARGSALPAALALVVSLGVAAYAGAALRLAAQGKPSSREGL